MPIRFIDDQPQTENNTSSKVVFLDQGTTPAPAQPTPEQGLNQAVDHAAGFSKSLYAVSLGALLLLTITFVWVLLRRRKSTQTASSPKAAPGPADFKMASLGVKRLSLVLALLVASGALAVACFTLSNGLGYFIGWLEFGLVASALTWFAVRVVDWIVRGFKFPR